MYEQSQLKQVRLLFPSLADDEDREYMGLISAGCTVEQFLATDEDLAGYVLVHPRTQRPITGDLYAQVADQAVLMAILAEDVSRFEF